MNPVRAGLVDRPEDYRWSSLGYRFHSSYKEQFLSWNLGLKEYNVKSPKERLRLYREFVYARGGVDTSPVKSCLQQGRSAAFNRASKGKILDGVPLPEGVERFIQRTRFFTDAGIIGSPVKSCCACHCVNFTGQARSLSARDLSSSGTS
ncbi:hypothetical protein AKJ60_00670 [candidate division MSBL1 archaeon SCGC-AAA385M11]|nr:hypothetical protein AKJ60_00670 [candidate division MSBL1 archaeon SCGC-AAA385M11]